MDLRFNFYNSKLYFMKQLFTCLLLFLFLQNSHAASGIFQTYAILNVNGGGNSYYHGGINSDGSSNNFNGRDFMSPTTLILNGGEMKTFKNGISDVFGAKINYRVYKSGATPGTFTEIDLPFAQDLGGGDQRWDNTSSNIDLMALATSNGTWVIEVFWRAPSSDGDHFDSDNGNNFTATFTQSLLPVELVHFAGTVRKEAHSLSWTTASEINNAFFEIQHSTNSSNWRTLGKVNGAGNSFEQQNYQFTNNAPVRGRNYYRLKQVDFDGQFEFSEVIALEFSKESLWEIYPNPVAEELSIRFDNEENASVFVHIFNANGQLIQTKTMDGNAENLQINVEELKAGLYFLQVLNGDGFALLQEQFIKK